MKEQEIRKNWILLEEGRNTRTVYHDYAVVITNEDIPLDISLFNDLDRGIERNLMCAIYDDPRKFSLSIPS